MSIYQAIEKSGESRRVYQLTSPIDLQPAGELVCASKEDVQAALLRAKAALPAWAAKSLKERADILRNAVKILLARQDEVMDLVVKETGKARTDALSMEVYSVADAWTYYAKHAKAFLGEEKRKVPGVLGLTKKMTISYKPLGVVGIIVPWNGPVVLGAVPAGQALLAGNAVLLKGSEVTPYSTKLVADILHEAGVPKDIIIPLLGDGQTGADLVESGVQKIAFTGSVRTGRIVAESCARQLIPCSLELGGKDAMIVCDDASMERAVAGAVLGSCMNTGHYCCGTERIYVMDSIYDEFLAKTVEATKELRQGSHLGFDEDVGAVFWERQMTIIEDHVEDARSNGATIHCGGRRNPELAGLYYEPTVITGINHDMKIMKEETFGPVICIQKVSSVEEALKLANDSEYGLNGNVWTKDVNKGLDIARRIETGGASVNDIAITYGVPAAPFGGVKHSGVGHVNSISGIRGYAHAQPIVTDKSTKPMPNSYPYSTKTADGMRKFMEILWLKTPIGRWLS